ncbi:hypothetical protein PHLCEN_2v5426 [Hermanssonia centrifuga]|uniref:F-box domain-containing protein n=1 Tax=Hermanssonia centrifuga TaxID=98765 RepID=A0A2R6P2G5_9APHY|nr:hypothetical protein PHLCEN_2v5426 [Hermanssonia centrifuga]
MLQSLLSLLPNLRDLAFSEVTLGWAALSEPEDWLAFRPVRLDSLSMLNIMTVSQTPLEIVASLCLFSSIKVLHIEMFVNVEDFEGHYDDPHAQPTHPLLLSTDNPYFPSKLRVSSIEVPNPSHVPFFLALIAKTASVEAITDVDVARDTNEQIRALGSFLRVVGPRIKKITADIVALSYFTISAPTTVQKVILDIRIGGITRSWRDQDGSDYISVSTASEFTHFQSAIKQREGVRKLCIRWYHMPQEKPEAKLLKRMDSLVRRQLLELDAKGILSFEHI